MDKLREIDARFELKKKWARLAHRIAAKSQRESMSKLVSITDAMNDYNAIGLRKYFAIWKAKYPWRRMARSLMQKCRLLCLHRYHELYSSRIREIRKEKWRSMAEAFLEIQQKRALLREVRMLFLFYKLRRYFDVWKRRMLTQRSEMQEKWVSMCVRLQRITFRRNLRALSGESVKAKVWRDLAGKLHRLNVLKDAISLQRGMNAYRDWHEITKKLCHVARVEELKDTADRMRRWRSWMVRETRIQRKKRVVHMRNQLIQRAIWDSLVHEVIRRMKIRILLTGRKVADQLKEKRERQRLIQRYMWVWKRKSLKPDTRNVLRIAFADAIAAYETSYATRAAIVIQRAFRKYNKVRKEKLAWALKEKYMVEWQAGMVFCDIMRVELPVLVMPLKSGVKLVPIAQLVSKSDVSVLDVLNDAYAFASMETEDDVLDSMPLNDQISIVVPSPADMRALEEFTSTEVPVEDVSQHASEVLDESIVSELYGDDLSGMVHMTPVRISPKAKHSAPKPIVEIPGDILSQLVEFVDIESVVPSLVSVNGEAF